MASLFKNWRTSSERIDKFLSDKYFTDANLTKIITTDVKPLTKIEHLKIVTNPKLSTKDSLELFDKSALKISEVISMNPNQWETVDKESFVFGNTWSIHWFRIEFDVPLEWAKDSQSFTTELHWNSECEVLLINSNGRIIQGLNATHSRTAVAVAAIDPGAPRDQHHHVLYIQASCSDLFGAGNNGLINAPDMNKTFKLVTAQLQLTSVAATIVQRDLKLLLDITEALPNNETGYQALHAANQTVNMLVDMTTDCMSQKLINARQFLDKFFSSKLGNDRLSLHAIGHCHIDTAWLWRYGETRRKLARSWSTVVGLLDRHPNMTFVCSQAQQMDWLRKDYPELFIRIKALAERKQFIPVGGTWVEMDVNLPCSESLCRQFLYGQNFYKAQFGAFCREFWLPDTFGYSPQLPQIMRQAGMTRFMTQKLSWSLVNKFPHHSFIWQGLDGSRVVTHFPPGDSYSMTCTVPEMLQSATNHADKGRAPCVMYLYGHGDGGQGPTEEMLYALDRLADFDGLPRITHSTPDRFYLDLECDNMDNLCTWNGELFLELHNGTYTTQRQLKLGNSRCEQLMRAIEMLVSIVILCRAPRSEQGDSAMATVTGILEQIEEQWKLILLNQFHDVLPGTSIEQVCDDAYWAHRSVIDWCHQVTQLLALILNILPPFIINPTSWPMPVHYSSPGQLVIPAYSIVTATSTGDPVVKATRVSPGDDSISLDYQFDSLAKLHLITNRIFMVAVDAQCRIRRMRLLCQPDFMNIVSNDGFGNQLVMYDDVPLFWDAWDVMDYHLETGTDIDRMASFQMLQEATATRSNHSVTLAAKFRLENTGTVVEQLLTVTEHAEFCQLSTKIEWHEKHRMIKVKVPTVINAPEAQYRTQAGFHSRPTHRNTSWDAAKYEVCGHDWIHLGEANWGIAVFKEAIFGSSVIGGSIYLSLLRAPTSPDATADRKYLPHVFNYALFPFDCSATNGSNRFATISRLAAQFTWSCAWDRNSLADCSGSLEQVYSFPISIAAPSNGEVAIDWIKPKGGNCRQFVMRLHEQTGGRFLVKLISSLPIGSATLCNILEERMETNYSSLLCTNESIELLMCPFVIASIIVEFAN